MSTESDQLYSGFVRIQQNCPNDILSGSTPDMTESVAPALLASAPHSSSVCLIFHDLSTCPGRRLQATASHCVAALTPGVPTLPHDQTQGWLLAGKPQACFRVSGPHSTFLVIGALVTSWDLSAQ